MRPNAQIVGAIVAVSLDAIVEHNAEPGGNGLRGLSEGHRREDV
jgi:hypothetical protein